MISLDPSATAFLVVDMHRGHLDPAVATLPLQAERCGPVIARAAELFREARAVGVPVVHVVTEYRDAAEILANPFWKAIHDDPGKARKGMSRHNLVGSPGTAIIPELLDPRARRSSSPGSTRPRASSAPPSRRRTATSA